MIMSIEGDRMKELHEKEEDSEVSTIIDGLTEDVAKSVLKTMVVGIDGIKEIFLNVLRENEVKRSKEYVDIEKIAKNVFDDLENIDLMECWVRSGKEKSGKNEILVDERVASEMFDEVMKPFTEKLNQYHEQGLCDAESDYLKGIFRGIDNFEKNHTNQLFELIDPSLLDYIGMTENEWSFRHSGDDEYLEAFRDYATIHLPDWQFIFTVEEWEEAIANGDLIETKELTD